MSRARRRLPNALMFAVALAFALPAWAAYDAFITGITGNTVTMRKAGGEQVSLQVFDRAALARLAVGQKLTVEEATGKVSMQDFHFTARVNTSSPKMMMATAPKTPPPPKQVMINGKLLTASARVVNGKVFVPLEDFSRAVGGNGITLNSSLKLEFPNLVIVGAQSSPAIKIESTAHKVAPAPAMKMNPVANLKMNPGAYKMGDGSVRTFQVLSLNRAGVLSSHLLKLDGKVFVPLADILIGLNQDPSRINANSMMLNFSVPAVQNSIIGVL